MTGTLVYDADCGFCTRSARWAESRMGPGNRVAPSAALDLDTAGLTRADVDAAAWWLGDDGSRRRGHLAIAAELVECRGAWPLLGRVIGSRVLSPVASRAYDAVARNRGRMPGSDGTCEL